MSDPIVIEVDTPAPIVIEVADATSGGAVDSVNGQTGVVVLDAADVGALPDDTALLALGETSTTAYRGDRGKTAYDYSQSHTGATDPHGDRAYAAALVDDLSGVTSAAAARTNLGLGSAATQASSAFDAAGSAAAAQAAAIAASQPLDPDLTAIAALATTVFGRSLLELADLAALVSLLGDTFVGGGQTVFCTLRHPKIITGTVTPTISTAVVGFGYLASGTTNDQELEWVLDPLLAGTYQLRIWGRQQSNGGLAVWKVNGTTRATFEHYAASPVNSVTAVSSTFSLARGAPVVRVTNPSNTSPSSAYGLYPNLFSLERVS